ncbi:hypothetical protein C487_02603 [Natrinema pallidum DSM 3751]|uniref:Uncharacterized protein n=1 Tax=Natrinema pallidum DSM 3751 TaxID=1227495 RepID=L9Z7D5_9EURY|nr:hypothetical protein C487_02603 [Natrinema pallidum DSM 3751]
MWFAAETDVHLTTDVIEFRLASRVSAVTGDRVRSRAGRVTSTPRWLPLTDRDDYCRRQSSGCEGHRYRHS